MTFAVLALLAAGCSVAFVCRKQPHLAGIAAIVSLGSTVMAAVQL